MQSKPLHRGESHSIAAREFGINYENKVKQLVRAIPDCIANPSRARAKGELAVGLWTGAADIGHWAANAGLGQDS